MARAKATTLDILARLAKGECANFTQGGCQGRETPCAVAIGEACDYFTSYVKPLLDSPEFALKYGREAKIAVAVNPKTKVIRKRRPTLDLDIATASSAARTEKQAPIRVVAPQKPTSVKPNKSAAPVQKAVKPQTPERDQTTVVTVTGDILTKPQTGVNTTRIPSRKAPSVAAPSTKATQRAVAPEQPLLLFDMPVTQQKRNAAKRR